MSSFEASGYVHNISPTKKSKKESKPYFNFDLQTTSSHFRRGVCYDEKMQSQLQGFQTSRSPVKLRNIGEKRSRDSDLMDVIVGKRSLIEDAPNTLVDFEYDNSHHDSEETVSVKIEELGHIKSGQMVLVEGRLTVVSNDIQEVVVNGQPKRLNENVVLTDETGSIPLSLWEHLNDALQTGTSYKLSSLRLKKFNGQRLTTTPATEYVAVDKQFPEPGQETVSVLFGVYEAQFDTIELAEDFRRWYSCKRCNKALATASNQQLANCSNCGAVQRIATCRQKVSVRITVEEEHGEQRRLTLFERELNVMLQKYSSDNPEEPAVTEESDPDKIYMALLLNPACVLRYRKTNAVVLEVRFP